MGKFLRLQFFLEFDDFVGRHFESEEMQPYHTTIHLNLVNI